MSGTTGGAGVTFLDCWDNARRMQILGNGNVQNLNNSYTGISDIKLKENIVQARGYLADLCKINVVKYSLKADNSKTATHLGVIAQEIEQIFPGLVEETDDVKIVDVIDENGETQKQARKLGTKTKAVKYSILVPMLVKAVQELKAEIDLLKASK
jgi:hypothetical protein